MDTKAIDLFERNPKVDTLYKVKVHSIYFTSKEGAEAHVEGDTKKLETLKREELLPDEQPTEKEEKPLFPEGDPTDDWKNAEIQAWMDEHKIDYAKADTKKELLEKVAAHLTPKSSES